MCCVWRFNYLHGFEIQSRYYVEINNWTPLFLCTSRNTVTVKHLWVSQLWCVFCANLHKCLWFKSVCGTVNEMQWNTVHSLKLSYPPENRPWQKEISSSNTPPKKKSTCSLKIGTISKGKDHLPLVFHPSFFQGLWCGLWFCPSSSAPKAWVSSSAAVCLASVRFVAWLVMESNNYKMGRPLVLVVISRVITPFMGFFSPQLPIYQAIFKGFISSFMTCGEPIL